MGMLNGLSLFSGIGGIDVALSEWVRPIAYCEIDPYCQGVLFSRMAESRLSIAPIWDDISTFPTNGFTGTIDIIYAGFPCQDISLAGNGKGLAGKRSGLFFEIIRLCREIKPRWIFLENVAAMTSRGGTEVVRTIAEMGYDCRWCVISAASIGALHRRERWFLLAHDNSVRRGVQSIPGEKCKDTSNSDNNGQKESMAHPQGIRMPESRNQIRIQKRQSKSVVSSLRTYWDEIECPLCGVADGVPYRMDRIKSLGNAVVPQQAKEAFKTLMGLK